MYCWKCGREIQEQSKYCGGCGAPSIQTVKETPAAPAKKHKGGTLPALIAVSLSLILIAAILAGIWYVMREAETNTEPSATSSENYDTYREIVMQLESDYGPAKIITWEDYYTRSLGSPDASGTYYIDLVDFAHDGNEALVIGYRTVVSPWYNVAIWSSDAPEERYDVDELLVTVTDTEYSNSWSDICYYVYEDKTLLVTGYIFPGNCYAYAYKYRDGSFDMIESVDYICTTGAYDGYFDFGFGFGAPEEIITYTVKGAGGGEKANLIRRINATKKILGLEVEEAPLIVPEDEYDIYGKTMYFGQEDEYDTYEEDMYFEPEDEYDTLYMDFIQDGGYWADVSYGHEGLFNPDGGIDDTDRIDIDFSSAKTGWAIVDITEKPELVIYADMGEYAEPRLFFWVYRCWVPDSDEMFSPFFVGGGAGLGDTLYYTNNLNADQEFSKRLCDGIYCEGYHHIEEGDIGYHCSSYNESIDYYCFSYTLGDTYTPSANESPDLTCFVSGIGVLWPITRADYDFCIDSMIEIQFYDLP